MRMHRDEFPIDEPLVRRLVSTQFPEWADFDLQRVESWGTDNAIFRLGPDLAVRLPRIERAAPQVEKEWHWLPRLAPQLPLPIPVPVAKGQPGSGFPWVWSVSRWLEGETATPDKLGDLPSAARDLAAFIRALQAVDATGAPQPGPENVGRGQPLARRDKATRAAIRALAGTIDTKIVTALWEESVAAPAWEAPPLWIHGDLTTGNLVVRGGALRGVIDFGCLAAGDPACDCAVAWTVFAGESRAILRDALAADAATWLRGRGWALSWALVFIPYYIRTNPVVVAGARRTIDEIVSEAG
jgi:aminoglycoside phosphotransferase (APT) family kinase protein